MQRVFTLMLNYFSKCKQIKTYAFLFHPNASISFEMDESIVLFNFKIKKRFVPKYIGLIWNLLKLRLNLLRIQPDVVVSFGEVWNSFVLLALANSKLKVYVADRNSPIKNIGIVNEFLRNKLYNNAFGIITQTKYATVIYEQKYYRSRIIQVANPVIVKEDIPEIDVREKLILSVGRLIPSKNFDRLIRIFSEVCVPGWKLMIVGEDPYGDNKQKLSNLLSYLKLDQSVDLVGATSNVNLYYRKSRIFCFTSESEGFPNVLLEAHSYGLPVVSYDCIAGPSDIIKDGENGFLINLFDDHNYIQKLKFLMKNNELQRKMSHKAIENARQYRVELIGGLFKESLLG